MRRSFASSRTSRRTEWPAARRARALCEPVKPVPPVTRTFIRRARSRAGRARRARRRGRRRSPSPIRYAPARTAVKARSSRRRAAMGGWSGAACGLARAGASPVQIAHDQSPSADFARYEIYAWIGQDPVGGADSTEPRVDPAVEASVRRAVDAELAARGYRLAPAEEADLLVG